jgi:hypothetical protein
MPLGDDAEEQIGCIRIARHVSEFVADQEIGGGVASQPALDGRQRLLPQQVRECGGERREADGVSFGEGSEAQVLCERSFPGAGLSTQQYVLAALDEAERVVQLFVERAVDRARMGPVEAVDRLGRAERGCLGAHGEISSIALALLECGELEAELCRRQRALGGVGEQGAYRVRRGTQTEGAQCLCGVTARRHRSLRGRGG